MRVRASSAVPAQRRLLALRHHAGGVIGDGCVAPFFALCSRVRGVGLGRLYPTAGLSAGSRNVRVTPLGAPSDSSTSHRPRPAVANRCDATRIRAATTGINGAAAFPVCAEAALAAIRIRWQTGRRWRGSGTAARVPRSSGPPPDLGDGRGGKCAGLPCAARGRRGGQRRRDPGR